MKKISEKSRCQIFLDARCHHAMAQVMLTIDVDRAKEFARTGIGKVIYFSQLSLDTEIPWPLRDVPILALTYEQGYQLGIRARAAAEARSSAFQRLEAQTPDATTMLASIQAGEIIELNCHSLGWDANFAGLMGTNAYGVDYYWGEMTLESVNIWRSKMLTGQQLGLCPLEAELSLEHGYIDWISEAMHQLMDSVLQQYIEQHEIYDQ